MKDECGNSGCKNRYTKFFYRNGGQQVDTDLPGQTPRQRFYSRAGTIIWWMVGLILVTVIVHFARQCYLGK